MVFLFLAFCVICSLSIPTDEDLELQRIDTVVSEDVKLENDEMEPEETIDDLEPEITEIRGILFQSKDSCSEGFEDNSVNHVFPTDCVFKEDSEMYERFRCYSSFWRYTPEYKICRDSKCRDCFVEEYGTCIPYEEGFASLQCPHGSKYYIMLYGSLVVPSVIVLVALGVLMGVFFVTAVVICTCLWSIVWGYVGKYVIMFGKKVYEKTKSEDGSFEFSVDKKTSLLSNFWKMIKKRINSTEIVKKIE